MKTISEQLDENIIGKLTYLPECLEMYVSKNEKTVVVNTGIPSDMFNVICLRDYDADWQTAWDMFHVAGLPFALECGFGDKGEKCRDTLAKSGFQKIKNFFICNVTGNSMQG